jgi:hypothetical protein
MAGRPLKFKSVASLRKKINAYFTDCDPHWVTEEYWEYPRLESSNMFDYNAEPQLKSRKVQTSQKPYLITGLALALGTSRETLLDYENGARDLKEGDEGFDPNAALFSDTIKDAKLKCQSYAENHLYTGKNATGAIFSLKNNYNWEDKTQVAQTGEVKHTYEELTDEQLAAEIQARQHRAA